MLGMEPPLPIPGPKGLELPDPEELPPKSPFEGVNGPVPVPCPLLPLGVKGPLDPDGLKGPLLLLPGPYGLEFPDPGKLPPSIEFPFVGVNGPVPLPCPLPPLGVKGPLDPDGLKGPLPLFPGLKGFRLPDPEALPPGFPLPPFVGVNGPAPVPPDEKGPLAPDDDGM